MPGMEDVVRKSNQQDAHEHNGTPIESSPGRCISMQRTSNLRIYVLASGQKAKNKTGRTKVRPMRLIVRPYRPRDHFRGGKGVPLSRRQTRQVIVTV